MSSDALVCAGEVLFWSLWGIFQAGLAVLGARLVAYGSLRTGPEAFLARIRHRVRWGDWPRVEEACRRDPGPFARLTLLYAMVRSLSRPRRQHTLAAGVGALLAAADVRARLLLQVGVCALAAGFLGGVLGFLNNLPLLAGGAEAGAYLGVVRRVAWPPLVGTSAFLACYGAGSLVRENLNRLALDLDLVLALLDLWSRAGVAQAEPEESPLLGQRQPPPFSDN